jgi:hypothetical protein
MGFSFSPSLGSDLDRVRLNIHDIEFHSGPLPDGANVEDETITALLTSEGNVACATAALFDYLAAAWRNKPVFGPGELSTIHVNVANGYEREASKWRERCADTGGGNTGYDATPAVTVYSIRYDDAYAVTIDTSAQWEA